MIWRAVPGWEGHYEVSDTGEVRSLDREVLQRVRGDLFAVRRYPGRVMKKLRNQGSRYLVVNLRAQGRKLCRRSIHTLVMRAFVGPAPAGMEVCHNDNNPTNNALSNLRYDTRSANALDRHAEGGAPWARGQQHWRAKLTEAQVLEIRSLAGTKTQAEIGRLYGVTQPAISDVITGRKWAHVQ